MSEYMEKHSVSKLIGSPPGYVGYGEGGLLTERVRRRPYSVILFDEIEKAHPDVLNLLLQIMEDGTLTDSTGRKSRFSSSVIIMTSNLLTHADRAKRSLGFSQSDEGVEKNIRREKKLCEFFKPEFINRIDEIILFEELEYDALCSIACKMLRELRERARRAGVELEICEGVAEHIADLCYSSARELGARPLRREIIERIETPLSEILLTERTPTVRICIDNEDISLVTLSRV
jgi:ATP-dependent Clp protease ATP-binding subunit ClpC